MKKYTGTQLATCCLAVAFGVAVSAFVLGLDSGYSFGKQEVRTEAVELGKAQYVVIDNLGNTQFSWK